MGRDDRRCDACGETVPPHAPSCPIVEANRLKEAKLKKVGKPKPTRR